MTCIVLYYIHSKKVSGGTIIIVHNSAIAHSIRSRSPFQTTSISVKIPTLSSSPISISSIYIPQVQNITTQDLDNFVNNIPSPAIICRNFNAHSRTWGSRYQNSRGNAIDSLSLNNQNVFILDKDKSPTRIDHPFCSTSLAPSILWKTHPDLCDSDHFPVILSNVQDNQIRYTPPPKWSLNKVKWTFSNHITASTHTIPQTDSIDHDVQFFTQFILDAAHQAVPKSSPNPNKRSVTWWSSELTIAIQSRKRAFKTQNSNDPNDLIFFEGAKARSLLHSSKKRSWSDFVANRNHPVPCSTMWGHIRRLSGSSRNFSFHPILVHDQIYQKPAGVSEILASSYAEVYNNSNYHPDFLLRKLAEESYPINFSPNTINFSIPGL